MKVLKMVLILVLTVGLCVPGFAIEEKRTAKIISLDGKAQVKRTGAASWEPAEVGMMLAEGDIIKTKNGSWALVNVNGKGQVATIEVKENSQLLFSELIIDKAKKSEKTLLDLAVGEILIKAQKVHGQESKFEVKTPTSIVGVRGTTFAVKVETLDD